MNIDTTSDTVNECTIYRWQLFNLTNAKQLAILVTMWHIEKENTITIARSEEIENTSLAVEDAFSRLEEIINESPRQAWLLDVSGISTVSSIAIARLIAIVRRIDINGGNIAMINVHPFVSSVLTTMRIVKVLSLFDSKEEAQAFLVQSHN